MNKYKARKTMIDGIAFDSKKEAKRYLELCDLQRDGLIHGLEMQVKYELIPKQYTAENGKLAERAIFYVADFVYVRDGETIVEDVKGYRGGGAYAVFRIKKKLMRYVHGIEVREV